MPQVFDNMPQLTGTLDTDENSIRWASRDYGDVVHHLPTAVLRPANATDIRTAVAYARQQGFQIVPRGQGHSTGGQAQALGALSST